MANKTDVSVIIVSFNTRELTCRAIETLLANAGDVSMQVLVWDNASTDGSAQAIADRFPDVELIRHADNLGFAVANNEAAKLAHGEYTLLLNPDTETHSNAVVNLWQFAKANPKAGIVGGRTVFTDGTLNPTSCWRKMTIWSLFCSAVGLTKTFPNSALFNQEGMGGWQRDSVRKVDIVTGCFFMISSQLWRELNGFDPRFFMYGEEADLCLRAIAKGYSPMITADAQIMHLGGASASKREEKLIQLFSSKASLIRRHWHRLAAPAGLAMLALWIAVRYGSWRIRKTLAPASTPPADAWVGMWRKRHDWLKGYPVKSR